MRSARSCLLGQRGEGQDAFLGLEIRIRQSLSGSGYSAEFDVADWRVFPDLPIAFDFSALRALDADVNAYGMALGQAVFDEDACGVAYKETLAVAQSAGKGLHVRLILEPPELQEIHWERIFHPYAGTWQPLGSTAATPFSRYVAVRQWDRPAPIEQRRFRILVAISSPADLEEWGLDPIEADERETLHNLFDSLDNVEPIYLESGGSLPPTLNEIRRMIGEGVDAVHFLCHGGRTEGGTVLYLEDDAGNVDPVTSEQLVDVVRIASTQPACVFLAACESAARTRFDAFAPIGPALVDEGGVYAAIAMTERVGLHTAQAFSEQFYTRLLDHGLVDLAVNEARALVQDEWDWGVPVLFMRVPDGRLLSERVPGWCVPVRILLLGLILLSLAAAVAVPFAQPIINPTQMDGGFKIAVADFGQMEGSGRIRASSIGSTLSKLVYDRLNDEYIANYAELVGDDASTIQIWHDSLGSDVKNVKLGVIRGATSEERSAKAQALAQKINADLVIYGNLIDGGEDTGLQLEFFNRSETLQGEPDAITGRHVVGERIVLPVGYESEPLATVELLKQPLSLRTAALFWITIALTYDVIDRQEDALEAMLTAQKQLAQWDDKDGQALLSYFTGREAFWLREYDTALEALNEAIRLKPEYANAYITRGATYYDQAQLFFTPQPIPDELAACINVEHLEQAAQSEDEALRLIDQSIESLEQAVDIAPMSPWPPIESVARLVLGNAYRLKGQAHLLGGRLAEAEPWYSLALQEFDRAEQGFIERDQQQYLAWTHLSRGATYYLQAFNHLPTDSQATDLRQGIDLFQQAAAEYQSCVDLGQEVFDLVFREKVLECGCEYYLSQAQVAQSQVEEYLGGE